MPGIEFLDPLPPEPAPGDTLADTDPPAGSLAGRVPDLVLAGLLAVAAAFCVVGSFRTVYHYGSGEGASFGYHLDIDGWGYGKRSAGIQTLSDGVRFGVGLIAAAALFVAGGAAAALRRRVAAAVSGAAALGLVVGTAGTAALLGLSVRDGLRAQAVTEAKETGGRMRVAVEFGFGWFVWCAAIASGCALVSLVLMLPVARRARPARAEQPAE